MKKSLLHISLVCNRQRHQQMTLKKVIVDQQERHALMKQTFEAILPNKARERKITPEEECLIKDFILILQHLQDVIN